MNRRRMVVYYSGRVQGVGFRYTVRRLAAGFEVMGMVRNLLDGRVELVAEGESAELEAFLHAIGESEVGCFVRSAEVRWETASGSLRGFVIAG